MRLLQSSDLGLLGVRSPLGVSGPLHGVMTLVGADGGPARLSADSAQWDGRAAPADREKEVPTPLCVRAATAPLAVIGSGGQIADRPSRPAKWITPDLLLCRPNGATSVYGRSKEDAAAVTDEAGLVYL